MHYRRVLREFKDRSCMADSQYVTRQYIPSCPQEATEVSNRVSGTPIGTHLGKPIYKTIVRNDEEYVFDRVAQCDAEGCPLDQLNKGEVLFRPGLIYRRTSQAA